VSQEEVELVGWLVGWSLTSLFSTNTAISETNSRRVNLALVFLCLFCVVVVYVFRLVNVCFCCVRFCFFFHTKPRDSLGERLGNDLFCVEWDVKS